MTSVRYLALAVLWLLVLTGLWSGVRISYSTLNGVAACPDAAGIPICYVVTLGYLGMLGALFMKRLPSRTSVFLPAWLAVTLIAIVGTGAELFAGDACPKSSGGTPMCFFSLAFCVLILISYLVDMRVRRATTTLSPNSSAH